MAQLTLRPSSAAQAFKWAWTSTGSGFGIKAYMGQEKMAMLSAI